MMDRTIARLSSDLEPIARRPLHDEVVARLRDAIIEDRLAPNERLNERVLCDRYGVSRTPLREALKVLAQEGLVTLLPHRGAVVTPLTVTELEQTIAVMRPLEVLVGALVVERIDEAGLAEVRALHHEMCAFHARRDLPSYFRANQAIHQRLVEETGNRILILTYEGLNTRIRRFRYRANLSRERWDRAVTEHGEILAALSSRDGLRLGRLMSEHLVNKAEAVKVGLLADSAGAEVPLPLRRD
jgi:DNA-binding GntR family transcriptional regulator